METCESDLPRLPNNEANMAQNQTDIDSNDKPFNSNGKHQNPSSDPMLVFIGGLSQSVSEDFLEIISTIES